MQRTCLDLPLNRTMVDHLDRANLGKRHPIMVIYLMAIGNSRKIMGEHKLGWLTNFFLAVTALVLVASSVLFFYGLATGQGGS